jgi:hypothetical protein
MKKQLEVSFWFGALRQSFSSISILTNGKIMDRIMAIIELMRHTQQMI